MTYLLAADTFGVRTFIYALLVGVLVGLIVYAVCLIVNHFGGRLPAQAIGFLVGVIAFALYLLDAID